MKSYTGQKLDNDFVVGKCLANSDTFQLYEVKSWGSEEAHEIQALSLDCTDQKLIQSRRRHMRRLHQSPNLVRLIDHVEDHVRFFITNVQRTEKELEHLKATIERDRSTEREASAWCPFHMKQKTERRQVDRSCLGPASER